MRKWTIREVEVLKQVYACVPNDLIAKEMKRTRISIIGMARNLGLKKEVFPSRFKNGHRTWNAGMNYRAGGRATETQFKKGRLPWNVKEENISIRTDGRKYYKWIRVKMGQRWKQLHRHNWEIKNGPIPPGMMLMCVDGDTLNCDPSNWKLMTRREHIEIVRKTSNRSRAMKYAWMKRKAKNRAA